MSIIMIISLRMLVFISIKIYLSQNSYIL